MYITPNSTIKICSMVPLDPTQEHTILFSTPAAQAAYFSTRAKYTFNNYSYQRHTRGVVKVEKSPELLFDCNYLAFQNTNFGQKWFYAFITSVEYVNNETAEIHFQIDPIQTYLFDFVLKDCFVEREHSASDNPGDNLVPENVELGEYVYDTARRSGYLQNKTLVVAATFDNTYTDAGGTIYAGLYSGLVYTLFDDTPAGAINAEAFISGAGTKATGFVSAFYYPTAMLPPAADIASPVYKSISIPRRLSGAFNGYTPRNKKLYTYPYNFLYVTNLQGNSANLRYEYFRQSGGSDACNFVLTGDYCPNPTFWLYPQAYLAPALPLEPYGGNYDQGMSIGGWGQVPFATDTYKAWAAQHGSSLITNSLASTLSGFVSGGGAGAAASFVGAAGSGLIQNSVQAAIQQFNPTAAMPKQAHGSFSPMSQLAIGALDFWFMDKHITPEFMQIIDDYFSKYGYATNRVKVPNLTARPVWNYVKTIGCAIDAAVNSGLPADDMAAICRIFDSGITFWRDSANVGNYSLNNDPVSI